MQPGREPQCQQKRTVDKGGEHTGISAGAGGERDGQEHHPQTDAPNEAEHDVGGEKVRHLCSAEVSEEIESESDEDAGHTHQVQGRGEDFVGIFPRVRRRDFSEGVVEGAKLSNLPDGDTVHGREGSSAQDKLPDRERHQRQAHPEALTSGIVQGYHLREICGSEGDGHHQV